MLSDERMRLTVLERGQLLRRLKEFYEAEHPETKQGAKGGNFKEKTKEVKKTESVSIPTFAKEVSQKTGKSETTIREEVQVATRIPDKVQEKIKDLPVADNKSD